MIEGSWGKSSLLAVVFALLLATTAPAALGATEAPSSFEATDSVSFEATGDSSPEFEPAQREPPAQSEPPSENNTTIAHRNPSEVSDESLGDVEVWLSREMAGRLSESADLSQEDRERARELVGNGSEYAELAEQYAEITNRSGSEDGPESVADFVVAGQLQREFFADVEQYHRVHEAYRDARANDETDRTLRLAHELERRAAAVNYTATRLNETYANISTAEQADLRNATRAIGEMRANVTRTQQTVRDRTLTRTELSVRATEPNGSFTDPVPLAGRLQTADGDPIADENVTLRVGNRTLNVTTDEEGRFEVAYRPTVAPVGDRSRAVVFQPGNESDYLWANATVEFGVRQVTPNVTISNRTAAIRYNETLTVNGTVAADGVGVPDQLVVVTMDGVRIAQNQTDADGSFGAAGRLPANVSNGSQSVRVRVVPENATPAALELSTFGPGASGQNAFGPNSLGPESDRNDGPGANVEPARDVAIAPANGSAAVTVETTPTSVSIAEVRSLNETAFVAGRLTTEGGEHLANQTVEFRIDDRSVGTATTNATGGFATTVELPSRLVGGDSTVRVVAAYSPSGGNLAPATADRSAELDSAGVIVSDEQLRYGAVGLLAVAALGAFVWRFRSSGGASAERDVDPEAGEAGEGGGRASEFADVRGRSAEALFDSATTALDEGRFDAAVVAAYGSVRRRFGEGVGTAPRTHWEFYVACRDAGLSSERLRRLERLTETYERAAFADEPVSEADAREAVDGAQALRGAAPNANPFEGEQFDRGRTDRESGPNPKFGIGR